MRTSTRVKVLAAILGVPGVLHFVQPKPFDSIVPDWVPGSPRATTYASGVVELAAAAMVLHPRTRRAGAWLAFATFLGVWPANIQAALDGGMTEAPAPFDTAAAAWGRLPFQLPMLWLARRVAKDAAGG